MEHIHKMLSRKNRIIGCKTAFPYDPKFVIIREYYNHEKCY